MHPSNPSAHQQKPQLSPDFALKHHPQKEPQLELARTARGTGNFTSTRCFDRVPTPAPWASFQAGFPWNWSKPEVSLLGKSSRVSLVEDTPPGETKESNPLNIFLRQDNQKGHLGVVLYSFARNWALGPRLRGTCAYLRAHSGAETRFR